MASTNLGRVAMNPMGAYNANTTYSKLDVVSDNGSSYVYINETSAKGHAPTDTTYWNLLASKGEVPINDSATATTNVWSASKTNTELGKKVTSVTGKGLSTNDYTNAEKTSVAKIEGIEDAVDYAYEKGFVSKNLFKHDFDGRVVNGITFTSNSDGSITANGTATVDTWQFIGYISTENDKAYRLTGCPSGGSGTTYYLYAQLDPDSTTTQGDWGNGKTFTSVGQNVIRIAIRKGVTVSNLVFKPMLVDADIFPNATYSDFEPYAMSNVELDEFEIVTVENTDVFPKPIYFTRRGKVITISINSGSKITKTQSTWATLGTIKSKFFNSVWTNSLDVPLYNYNGIHVGTIEISRAGTLSMWCAGITDTFVQTSNTYVV